MGAIKDIVIKAAERMEQETGMDFYECEDRILDGSVNMDLQQLIKYAEGED